MTLPENDKLLIAETYIAVSQLNDPDGLAALCREDCLTWHNFDEKEVGVSGTLKGLAWIHRTVPDVTWTTVSLKTTSDGFVWQSLLEGTAPGGPLHAHSCVLVTLDDDGKLTRVEEYLDTAQTTVLRG